MFRWSLEVEELEMRLVPTLVGQHIFPLDNPWNQNIANAPVAANSAAIIAHIGASTRVTPNWYADNPSNGDSPLYGMPYNVVHGNSTAKVNVIIDNYPGESDIVPVPIPANAVIEGDFQDGPNPNGGGYNLNQRGDSHLIVWDEDNNVAYELFGVSRPTDPTLFPNTANVELPHTDGLWHAAQESVWNMNTDSFRTLGETSADAAGLSILAGLARPDEGLPVSQGGQGAIDHALRVTLPAAAINPQYIYPGSHMVSTMQGPDNLPLGSRLRLANTPTIDSLISNMPPESQIIAHAMQQYGLIVADIGSAMYVSGASASVDAGNNINLTWDLNDIFATNGLEALNAGDFQVVNLTPVVTGLSASSAAPGTSIIVTGQNFSGAAGHLSVFFGSTAASSVTVLGDTQLSVVVPSGSGTVDVTVQSGINETDNFSSNPNANVNAPIFGYGISAESSADQFTFTTVTSSPPTTVYVDPSFTGAAGSDPATDPGLGLQIGVNAFSTIAAALPAVQTNGTVVLFGGTYSEPSVNFNVPLSAVDIATNPSDSPVSPTVTITNAVTLADNENFALTGIMTGTGSSVAANLDLASSEAGPGTLTITGTAGVTFEGPVSGAVTLLGGTLNPTATLTLGAAGSLTLGPGVSETAGALASSSSSANVQLGSGSTLTADGASSSIYAGSFSGSGTLDKAGSSTSITLSGTSTNFTGAANIVGTLVVNGTLGTSPNPVNLTAPSSVLEGDGIVNAPVVITSTAAGASVSSSGPGALTITAKGGTGVDVQAGANNASITKVIVTGSNIGIALEPGSANMAHVAGNTITGNLTGVEPLNGNLTVTANLINGNNVGVEIPATNPGKPLLPVNPLLTLEGNDLSGNSSFGMVNASPMGVTAILNWWGSASDLGVPGFLAGMSVDDYAPFALDTTSVGPNPTTFDFFNGEDHADGNVYVTGTLGTDTITATVDATNSSLIHVTVNGGPVNNYHRMGASNRIIIYGFGDDVAGARDSITVGGDTAAAPWNAQINSEALKYREPISFGGTSSTTISTTGFGSDVIFGGGNDNLSAMTSGNNVLVGGLSTGKTGALAAPKMAAGAGSNIFIAGSVDWTLAPLASTGRLDYETLAAMDVLWASGSGGQPDALSAAALYSVVNTPGAIQIGTARALITPAVTGKNWYIVKGTSNPSNTPTGLNQDYIAGSTLAPDYRQATQ